MSVLAVGGIENVVFEDGYVRGVNPEKTFAIISNTNVPKFPQKIGISRVSTLASRLAVFKGKDPIIEARETERGEIAMLDITAGRSKVQFRCTSTMLIKFPKGEFNDARANVITLTKEEIKTILDAIRVMSCKKVTMSIRKSGEVKFDIPDESNDTFTVTLCTGVKSDSDSVVHYYQSTVFVALLKSKLDNDTTTLDIGEMGTILTTINDHSVAVLPQIGDSDKEE